MIYVMVRYKNRTDIFRGKSSQRQLALHAIANVEQIDRVPDDYSVRRFRSVPHDNRPAAGAQSNEHCLICRHRRRVGWRKDEAAKDCQQSARDEKLSAHNFAPICQAKTLYLPW